MKSISDCNGGREHARWPGKRPSRRWLKLFLLLRNAGTGAESPAKRRYRRNR